MINLIYFFNCFGKVIYFLDKEIVLELGKGYVIIKD